MSEENLDTTGADDQDNADTADDVVETPKKTRTRKKLTPEELDRKDFDKCLKHGCENEVGLANVAGDRGGLTKYGVTQRTLSSWLGRPATDDEVLNMKMKTAGDIYHEN